MTQRKSRSPVQSMQLIMVILAVVLLLIVFASPSNQGSTHSDDMIPSDEQCRESINITTPSPQDNATEQPPSSETLTWSKPVRGIADCRFLWDMGLNAYRTTAIAVRANGSEVQFQGKLPDGTMAHIDFEHLNVETLEFAAVQKPVTIEVYWANSH